LFLLALNSTLGERINQARGFNSKQNYKKSNNDFLILIRKIYCYAPLAFKLLIQSAQSAEINHSRRGEGNNHQAGSNKTLSYIPGTGIGLTVSKEKKKKFMSLSLRRLVNPFPAPPHASSTCGREAAACRQEVTAGILATDLARRSRACPNPLPAAAGSQRLRPALPRDGMVPGAWHPQWEGASGPAAEGGPKRGPKHAWSQAHVVPSAVSPALPSFEAAPGVSGPASPNRPESPGGLQGCSTPQRTPTRCPLPPASTAARMEPPAPTGPPSAAQPCVRRGCRAALPSPRVRRGRAAKRAAT